MLVTSNEGKYREYRRILEDAGLELDLKLINYPEEQLDTIEEVAEHSALFLTGTLKTDFFIDDSGLFVDALGGFPGVYSAYVQKTIGNNGIIQLMEGKENRSAQFRTCVAYFDGRLHLFTGTTVGSIAAEGRGNRGFGFDPIFIPDGHAETYAEMTVEQKNSISHRSKAAWAFLDFIKKKKI